MQFLPQNVNPTCLKSQDHPWIFFPFAYQWLCLYNISRSQKHVIAFTTVILVQATVPLAWMAAAAATLVPCFYPCFSQFFLNTVNSLSFEIQLSHVTLPLQWSPILWPEFLSHLSFFVLCSHRPPCCCLNITSSFLLQVFSFAIPRAWETFLPSIFTDFLPYPIQHLTQKSFGMTFRHSIQNCINLTSGLSIHLSALLFSSIVLISF